MSSTLTIGGTAYTVSGRATARMLLDRMCLSVDDADTLEFHDFGRSLPPQFHPGQTVEWDDAGPAPYFKGEIVQAQSAFTQLGWCTGYQCRGLKYVGNKIPITNPFDSSGVITFNLPSTDINYVPALSGQSIGAILQAVFTDHAAALTAIGIAGVVVADYTPLTLVPPQPVTFQGPLFNSIDTFLDQWAGLYSCWVEYHAATSDWRIRIVSQAAFGAATLTLGTDPIDPPTISRDSTGSYSRVLYRGRNHVEALIGSVRDTTLVPIWSAPDQAAWKWSDFSQPAGATDYGTISTLTSTTALVTSHSGSTHWITNFWSINEGTIWNINPAATGILQQEVRAIIACTAMTAGGTATITFDRPLANGGYTNYQMTCQPPGTKVDVWRRYGLSNTFAAAHLVRMFNADVAWGNMGSVVRTSYPIGAIVSGSSYFPATFEIDPTTGTIRFDQPTVSTLNSQQALDLGGAGVKAPDDVLALIAYARGTLTSVAPSSGFQGTFFTADGVSRTWTIDDPGWINAGAQAQYDALAQAKLDTVKDTVLTGSCVYNGKYVAGLTRGMLLNIAGTGYTTGYEAIAAVVRSVTLEWPDAGANAFTTTLAISSRRKQGTGDTFYAHPAFTGGAAWQVTDHGFNQGGATSIGVAGTAATAGFAPAGAASDAFTQSASAGGNDFNRAATGAGNAFNQSAGAGSNAFGQAATNAGNAFTQATKPGALTAGAAGPAGTDMSGADLGADMSGAVGGGGATKRDKSLDQAKAETAERAKRKRIVDEARATNFANYDLSGTSGEGDDDDGG
jgi:hypothetical protein